VDRSTGGQATASTFTCTLSTGLAVQLSNYDH